MGLSSHQDPRQEGTYHVKATKWRPALKVTADGKGLATHAGSRLLAEMADRSGLTDALSEALAPMCKRRRHDPGKVIADLAVTIASGGDALANLLGLRLQPDVYGSVASVPTAFRVIDAIDDTLLAAIRQARSRVRAAVWKAGLNPVTEHGYVTLDFDATLLDAHSDKQHAAPTYKKGYGFSPSAHGWTTPPRPWQASCARATPGPTPQPTTSRSWTWPWRSCRWPPGASIPSTGWPCWPGQTPQDAPTSS